jgi:thiol:disulfide interchange protein
MTTETATSIQWTEDVDQALAESKKTGKPLLLDFTAAPM